MQKWEYALVLVGKVVEIKLPNGQSKPATGELLDVLNTLGEDGWELVTSSFGEPTIIMAQYVFKRAKPADPGKASSF